MRSYLKYIAVIDHNNNIHNVELFPGINIITGKSSTGKSALIEIFDYCFGNSEYTVPEGVITENASIYFIVLSIKETFLILARKPNEKKAFIKEVTDIPDLEELNQDYFDSSYFIGLKEYKLELGRYFGIDIIDTDEDLSQRHFRKNNAKKPRPTIRNFTSFMLQHQNLIANKHSLFYRFDEKEKREQTIEQFKIFAGYVSQEYFTKRQELNEIEIELKRLGLKLTIEENEINIKKEEIDYLLKEYSAITGTNLIDTKAEQIVRVPKQSIDKMEKSRVAVNENADEYMKQLRAYEQNKNILLAEKRELEIKLREIDLSIEYANKYKDTTENTFYLNTLKIHYSECPFCKNNNTNLLGEANKLQEAIYWLNTELGKTPYMLDSFLAEQKKIKQEIENKQIEILEIERQINAILRITKELRKNRSLEEQGLKIRLKVEAILDTLIKSGQSNTKDEIAKLKKKRKEVEVYINEHFNLEKKMQDANRYLNEQMNALGKLLDFEDSYQPINLHFDLASFDLWHEKADGAKVYLRSMGSGANWLYCHLSLFLGLNRYFCSLGDTCLIPPILFLDQPSQVYFPVAIKDDGEFFDAKALKDKEGKNEDVDDMQAVENFFNQIVVFCEKTVEKTGITPQIIITDHADKLHLEDADFEMLVNGRRWRSKDDGFIKKDTTNQN
ncbi:DUF3732 domain-containing protein [Parabacteroides segnis]|uniref:DUF3732 domain-containing protein n=1 Tax=Parabacteroides segnis TaxID=2763058 RepID=UPI0035177B14